VLVIGGLLMTRSMVALAVFLFATSFAASAAENPRDPHIRSTEHELSDELARGARQSPTLSRLVDHLEMSDVVVYLTFDRMPTSNTAGRISLIAAAPGRRYLRVSIDRRIGGCQRLALLGHELQHAVEIADAMEVVDAEGVASLYKRIGFRSDRGRDCYDSQLAIQTGQRIQREVLGFADANLTR
jgi:hypothetical protein